jgi:hypothetical protein
MGANVARLDSDSCAVRVVDADRVAASRERLIPPGEVSRVTELFRLLGDPTRVQILYALSEAGELCVCDIAAVVDMTEDVGLARPAAAACRGHRPQPAQRADGLLLARRRPRPAAARRLGRAPPAPLGGLPGLPRRSARPSALTSERLFI